MTEPANDQSTPVRQLRVVVAVDDYDAAVAFYRELLGLPELAAFAEGGEDRVAILDAGRATLELANPVHARAIDRVDADGLPSPRIRLAFEVDDARATTGRLAADGAATVLAEPVLTPWRSLNSRLDAPGDLVITLFEETESATERAARPGFARDAER